MKTLEQAQDAARALSQLQDELTINFKAMQAGLQAVKDQHQPYIKKLVRKLIKARETLAQFIVQNPQLFDKPRTYTVEGIKFGLQKQKGKLSWSDDAALCAAIQRLVGTGTIDEALLPQLIKVTQKPIAKALDKLDAQTIKRLGIMVGKDTDAALIKSVDSEAEKAINALLQEADKELQEQLQEAT